MRARISCALVLLNRLPATALEMRGFSRALNSPFTAFRWAMYATVAKYSSPSERIFFPCQRTSPAAGEVRWQGKNIRSLGEEYFATVAYIAHRNAVKGELSALENPRISSAVAGNRLSKTNAQEILARIGLSRQQNLPARALSAGQQRRLAMARLLTANATVWILDEVLTSLDDAAVNLSQEFINQHLQNGGIAVIATHQNLNL